MERHKIGLYLQETLKRKLIYGVKKLEVCVEKHGEQEYKFFHKVVEVTTFANNLSYLFINGRKETNYLAIKNYLEDLPMSY